MDQENNKQNIRVAVNTEAINTLFSDTVQVEATPDHVILNFIQFLPGRSKDQTDAKVVSRVVLTWPHFARLTQLLPNILEQNKKLAYDSFLRNVLQEEEVVNGTRN